MKDALLLFGILVISAISIFLGTVYSIHNIDPLHWGFILGTALDFIAGKALFSQIYIQYGVGQPILFDLLSYAIPINYTTIGIVASVAYALNFPVIFASVRKVTNSTQGFFIALVAFLVHPFAIYPWPDYFAGFCISLSCWFLVTASPQRRDLRYIFCGIFLFLAFLFRNTYLLVIAPAAFVYVGLSLGIGRLRHVGIYRAIAAFALLVVAYGAFLLVQGNLGRWYSQDFGAAAGSYGMGVGALGKLALGFISVTNVPKGVMLGLFLLGFCTIVYALRRGGEARVEAANGGDRAIALFLALLGGAGASQAMFMFEIFRLQNTAPPLYVALAYLLKAGMPKGLAALKEVRPNVASGIQLGTAALITALIGIFPYALGGSPNHSTLWPIVEASPSEVLQAYSPAPIAIFDLHRFRPAAKKYYEDLVLLMCDGKRQIVNLTEDPAVSYLCAGQKSAIDFPLAGRSASVDQSNFARMDPQSAARIRKGAFRPNEVIVTDGVLPPSPGVTLKLIGTTERPGSVKWMGGGPVSVFQVEAASAGS